MIEKDITVLPDVLSEDILNASAYPSDALAIVSVVEAYSANMMRSATEFDPALATRHFVIGDKPIRPLVRFPITDKRKFLKSWYDDHAWLEYSISKDAAFCFSCRKFGTSGNGSGNGNAESSFVITGKKM